MFTVSPSKFINPLNLNNITSGAQAGAVINVPSSFNLILGDINSDGLSDIITPSGILFGNSNIDNIPSMAVGGNFVLNGNNGFAFNYNLVSYVCDINNDGVDDLITLSNNNPAIASVIFGKKGQWPAIVNTIPGNGPIQFNGTDGFIIKNFPNFFISENPCADINGDGVSDMIFSAPLISTPTIPNSGMIYTIFGHNSPWSSVFNITDLNGQNGFQIYGTSTNAQLSQALNIGDFNGDDIDDLIINSNPTASILFGSRGGWQASAPLSTYTNGIRGITTNLSNLSPLGDINGDGLGDVYYTSSPISSIIFGYASNNYNSINQLNLNGKNGFNIRTTSPLTPIGDINGDGLDDVSTSYPSSSTNYILFGKKNPWPSSLQLSTPKGFNVLNLTLGQVNSVSGKGDINGDGYGDFVCGITTPLYNPSTQTFVNQPQLAIVLGGNVSLPDYNYNPPQIANNPDNHHTRDAVIGAVVGGGAALLAMYAAKRYSNKRTEHQVSRLVDSKSLDNVKGDILKQLATETFNTFRTTGLCGYRKENLTDGYIASLEQILQEMQNQGFDLNVPAPYKKAFISAIIEEIKLQIVKPATKTNTGWAISFVRPVVTPRNLMENAQPIAQSIILKLHSNTSSKLSIGEPGQAQDQLISGSLMSSDEPEKQTEMLRIRG